jgi:hypothetical protein
MLATKINNTLGSKVILSNWSQRSMLIFREWADIHTTVVSKLYVITPPEVSKYFIAPSILT